MTHRSTSWLSMLGVAMTWLVMSACAAAPRQKPLPVGKIETGAGSLTETRKTLEGTWRLESLQLVDTEGAHRYVKADGQLTYDAFGNMTVRGVIDDAAANDKVVLNYSDRVTIDPVKHEYYPADLTFDRPVDQAQIAPISPDKVRRFEVTGNSLVVTYLDASTKPTAVIKWRK